MYSSAVKEKNNSVSLTGRIEGIDDTLTWFKGRKDSKGEVLLHEVCECLVTSFPDLFLTSGRTKAAAY